VYVDTDSEAYIIIQDAISNSFDEAELIYGVNTDVDKKTVSYGGINFNFIKNLNSELRYER
jgi:hypothetical protein